jgi:hypothetical protein
MSNFTQTKSIFCRDDSTKYIKNIYNNTAELNISMRDLLNGWLIDVVCSYYIKVLKLESDKSFFGYMEVLYMTFEILDRYIQRNLNVRRKDYQLLGCAALTIASGLMDDNYKINIPFMSYISSGGDISIMTQLQFEIIMSGALYNISHVNACSVEYEKGGNVKKRIIHMMETMFLGKNVDDCIAKSTREWLKRYSQFDNGVRMES